LFARFLLRAWLTRPWRSALSQAVAPNDLWCTDFKGEFKLGDGRYC
jgi:hypothetical protein